MKKNYLDAICRDFPAVAERLQKRFVACTSNGYPFDIRIRRAKDATDAAELLRSVPHGTDLTGSMGYTHDRQFLSLHLEGWEANASPSLSWGSNYAYSDRGLTPGASIAERLARESRSIPFGDGYFFHEDISDSSWNESDFFECFTLTKVSAEVLREGFALCEAEERREIGALMSV